MSEEESRSEFIRAKKSLEAAETLFKNGFYEDSISRSYYTILHAAKAALILEKISVDSHSAVRRLFGRHLIRSGKFDNKYAKILSKEQDMRFRADYDSMYIAEEEDARECIDEARDFLFAVKNYLKVQSVRINRDNKDE